MKHGSHIMLQRFVRSIVRTEPRPYWMDDVPWLWSVSVTALKSRPGNSCSMRVRKLASMASVSVKVPWIGHVFSTITWPFRSTICALISPTCSLTSVSIDCSPDRIRRRASLTHVGHSESVDLGHPSGGLLRSWLFMSGAGAHLGWNVLDSSLRLTA